MGDIVKEFNMIDLLGLMLPGAFITIIFGQEFGVWAMLRDFFGSDNCIGSISVIILVGGYVVGMLLHEIGDLLEKILWLNPLTNPRLYAARATGLDAKYNELQNGESVSERNRGNHQIRNCIAYWLGPGVVLFFVFFAFGVALNHAKWLWFSVAFVIQCILICVLNKWIRNSWFPCKSNEQDSAWNTLRDICGDDARLMYIAARKRAVEGSLKNSFTRKLDLFDGFRAMARNIFVALCILLIYAKYPAGSKTCTNTISQVVKTVYNQNVLLCALFFVSAVLLLRYWHFSYLKYKYCYEEIVFHSDEDEDKKEKTVQCPICAVCITGQEKQNSVSHNN